MREPHELAIQAWAETVLQDLDPAYIVIFSHPDAPSPARPYATIQMLSDVRTARETITSTDEAGVVDAMKVLEHLDSDRRLTLSISMYADAARTHARQLELSLLDPEADDAFEASGLRVRHVIGQLADQHTLRSAVWEHWASVDFEAAYVARRTHEIGSVEEVVGESTTGDLDGLIWTQEVA